MGMDPDPDTLTRNPSKKGIMSSLFNRPGTVERKQQSPRETSSSLRTTSLEPRRPLKTVELSPPYYKVEQDILIQSYIEIPIKYLGVIAKVPFALDATKRTELLRLVDQGRRQHKLPWNSRGREHDGILTLSVRQVKLLKRDGEELLQRFQIHNIAVVSYVRDDDQHILAFKTATEGQGSGELCNLVICECENKERADEICSLINQTFDLVYQELTMNYFNKEINAVRGTGSLTSSNDSTTTLQRFPRSPPSGGSTPDFPTPTKTETGSHVVATLLQTYIQDLRKQLNSEELQQFAAILREYRQTGSITEFCSRLQQLYGPKRTNLFPGMRNFVPHQDVKDFQAFLFRNNIHGDIYSYHRSARSSESSIDTESYTASNTSYSDTTSESLASPLRGKPAFFTSSVSSMSN